MRCGRPGPSSGPGVFVFFPRSLARSSVMSPRSGAVLVFGMLVCLVAVGCSGGPAKLPQAEVKGSVKLDGKPMDSGEVMFAITGEVPDTLQVTNGAFEGKAKIGKARVEVRSYKQGKETKMGDMIIPASQE